MRPRAALLAGLVGLIVLGLVAPAGAVPFGGFQADALSSPDSRFVYLVGANRTRIYTVDSATGKLAFTSEVEVGSGPAAMSPDGSFLYLIDDVMGGQSLIRLRRDAASGALSAPSSSTVNTAKPTAMAVSADGRHLYLADPNSITTFTRDPVTGGLLQTGRIFGGPASGEVEGLDRISDLAVSPDGSTVYAAAEQLVSLGRDPVTGALSERSANFLPVSPAFSVATIGDGRVVAGGADYGVYRPDAETGGLERVGGGGACSGSEDLRLLCPIGVAAPSPDGALIAAVSTGADRLAVFRDGEAGPELAGEYTHGESGVDALRSPTELVWTADSQELVVVTEEGLSAWRRTPGPALAFVELEPYPAPDGFLDPLGFAGVTIDGGASFVRSPEVALSIRAPSGAVEMQVSNDPGFAGAPPRPITTGRVIPWTLEDTGLGRDVRRVYVRFTTAGSEGPVNVSDDVILDRRPPVVVAAALTRTTSARPRVRAAARRRAVLRLRVRDNRSGVRRLQVTTRRSRPGRKRPFRRRTTVAGTNRRLYVRVFDGAGNPSRWRTVRRRR